MRKIFNSVYNREVLSLMPGEFYASKEGELISTLLGSCIAVCLYDEVSRVGGMNHFLLPVDNMPATRNKSENLFSSSRYGVTAMEKLIMKMQLAGSDRDRLKAKVFGGGNVLSINVSKETVGERNISFIHQYLSTEKIPIVSEDVGGDFSRKILLDTSDFSVKLDKTSVDSSLIRNEQEYMKHLGELKERTRTIYF